MSLNLRARWLNLLHTLWFVPTLIGFGYVLLAVGLVRVDSTAKPQSSWVFSGSAHAARTVLSTIAGSLITVAGLTFSVTMVVLQLTSTQFSPRVVRNYLGDRVAQVTIGSFVGIFAYCLVALRSIGAAGADHVPVPRLTVTVASALALLSLALLVAFIHHIAQLVQASELTARLGSGALSAIEQLYPEPFADDGDGDADELVARWRGAAPRASVPAHRAGYVQSIELAVLEGGLGDERPRLHLLVAPGDFVGDVDPLVEVWPAAAAERVADAVRRAVTIAGERDNAQDAHFPLRQLTDIALRAISPSINDPTTAATCIGYLRSALTRIAARDLPPRVHRPDGGGEPLVVRRRSFAEYVDLLAEIGRYAGGDARIVRDLVRTAAAIVEAALGCGAAERAHETLAVAEAIAEQALDEVRSGRDRALVEAALERVEGPLLASPQVR